MLLDRTLYDSPYSAADTGCVFNCNNETSSIGRNFFPWIHYNIMIFVFITIIIIVVVIIIIIILWLMWGDDGRSVSQLYLHPLSLSPSLSFSPSLPLLPPISLYISLSLPLSLSSADPTSGHWFDRPMTFSIQDFLLRPFPPTVTLLYLLQRFG